MLIVGLVSVAHAQDSTTVYIVEVQTGSVNSASEEFVEIFNPTAQPVRLDGFLLQYLSASGENWITKAELSGEIPIRGRYLISTYIDYADESMSSGLSTTGGHLRVMQPLEDGELVYDVLGWGDASYPEGYEAAFSPENGTTLKRAITEDGLFVDTNINAQDFVLSYSPSPQTNFVYVEEPEPEAEEPKPTNSKPPTGGTKSTNPTKTPGAPKSSVPKSSAGSSPVIITELLIDPDKPLTDAEDEFVELYNPSSQTISLSGLVLETGSTFSYSFELPAISMNPGEYKALYSVDTGLTLSNTEGGARISTNSGAELDRTAQYQSAKPDAAWAKVGESWNWSTPTPGKPNTLPAGSADTQGITAQGQEVATLRTDTPSYQAYESTESESSSDRNEYEDESSGKELKLNNSILVGIGVVAVLYAGYEYRHNVINRINQFREYLKHRRASRRSS